MNHPAKHIPVLHTLKIKAQMRQIMNHLREEVGEDTQTKAKTLFEPSSEVLARLVKAFDDYERKGEEAWRTRLPDKAREVYQIPEHFEAWTAMAIGYKADPATLPEALKKRDMAPRQRRPLGKFVFTGQWGQPSPLVQKLDT